MPLIVLPLPAAGATSDKGTNHNYTLVFSGRGGVDFLNTAQSNRVLLYPFAPAPDNYVSMTALNVAGSWGLFGGIEKIINPVKNYFWQNGVAYYGMPGSKIHGVIEVFGDQGNTDLNFAYSIKSQRILWESKIAKQIGNSYSLYALAGFGAAYNKAYSYYETQRQPNVEINPSFASRGQWGFAYSFGTGVEFIIKNNIRVGIGYQFTDLGQIGLGKQQNQLTEETIHYRYLDNALICTINYLIST